jgi:putative serine protease PepD
MVDMTDPAPWQPPQPPPVYVQQAGGGWGPPPADRQGGGWMPPPPPPRRQPGGRPPWNVVAIMVVAAAVLGGAIGGLLVRHNQSDPVVGSVTIGSQTGQHTVVERAPGSDAAVAAKILPSVVSIEVRTGSGGDTGSGIVLTKTGYIMTNNHVIAAAKTGGVLSVVLPNKSKVSARIVGHPDPVDDIAIIKVAGVTSLVPAVLGDSNSIRVGDQVIAVGSPLGLAGTVTSGIVSALNRPVEAGGEPGVPEDVIDAIQTDAAINPGNSGGPLVNSSGQVVGVNSAIASLSTDQTSGQQSGSIGLGFAIPINEAKRIAGQIISQGYSTHAIIGVNLDPTFTGSGARIAAPSTGGPAVTAGGPAAKAGLQAGDVIVAVDGETVTTADELIVAIRRHVPGQRLSLTYVRDGKRTTVSLVLAARRSE